MGSIFTHRLGSDLYFILFGVFGMFLIPSFFYLKMRKNWDRKQAADLKYGITQETDLDERSLQFIPHDRQQLRKHVLHKHQTQQKLKELEKEVYGY